MALVSRISSHARLRQQAGIPDHVDALLERFHPDELDYVLEIFNEAIADKAPVSHYDMKFRVRLADGAYRWFRSIGNVKHNPAGVATRACGSIIDIHDGELAAAELQQHSERERSVLANAHAASQNRFEQIADTSIDDVSKTRYASKGRDEIIGRGVSRLNAKRQLWLPRCEPVAQALSSTRSPTIERLQLKSAEGCDEQFVQDVALFSITPCKVLHEINLAEATIFF